MAALSLVFDILARSDRASREFDAAGDSAQKMGREIDKASQDAGKSFGGLGDMAKKAGPALAAGLAAAGVAAGAALFAGVKESISREAGADKLAAQLGISGEESKELGKVAGDLYSNAYGESLGQVNDAIRTVVQNIGVELNDADLSGITASVLDLSTAFDQDLGGTTRAVGALLKNGLAPNAQAALDIVTAGFQNGVDKSEDFTDTLNEYSPLFGRLGLDGAKATGLISQGLKAGARDADTVADALKEFQIRATDGSKTSAEGFALLGLNAGRFTAQIAKGGESASAGLQAVLEKLRATEDPVKRNAAAVALFGTKAEDLGASLFALDTSTAVGELGKVEGAAAAMGDTLNDNASTRIEGFKRKAQEVLVDFVGSKVIPSVTQLAGVLFTGDFKGGPFQEDSPIIAGLFALREGAEALLPHLSSAADFIGRNSEAFTSLALGIVAVTVAARIYTGVQAAMNAVILLNPYVAAAAALAALAGGLIYAYRESETFRNAVNAVAERVGGFAQDIGTRLVPVLREFAALMQEKVTTGLALLRQKFEENRPQIELFIGGLKLMFDSFQKIAGFIVSEVLPVLGKFVGFLVGEMFVHLGTFIDLLGDIVRASTGALSSFLGMTSGIIGGIQKMLEASAKVPSPFRDDFRKAAESVGEAKRSVDTLKGGLDALPLRKDINVNAATGSAVAGIGGVSSAIVNLPATKTVTVVANVGDAARKLAAIAGLTAPTNILGAVGRPRGDGPGAGGPALTKVSRLIAGVAGARITSTYRSPAQNAAVGGSPSSYHMDRANPAVDIAGPTGVLDRLFPTLRAAGGWRELLWRVPGHFDHIHAAHNGLKIGPGLPRLPGDGPNERTLRTLVGERVLNTQETREYEGGGRSASVNYHGPVYVTDPDAWARRQADRMRDALAVVAL